MFKNLFNSIKSTLATGPSTVEEYEAAILQHLEEDATDDAILLAEKGLEAFPEHERIAFLLGKSYTMSGNDTRAISVLETLMEQGCKIAEAPAYLAMSYINKGEYAKSEVFFEKQKSTSTNFLLTGNMYHQMKGDTAKARAFINQLKHTGVGDDGALALFEEGYLNFKEGLLYRGLQNYLTACTAYPEIEEYYNYLEVGLAVERCVYFEDILNALIEALSSDFADYQPIQNAFDRGAYEEALTICRAASVEQEQQYALYLMTMKALIYLGEIYEATELLEKLTHTLELTGLEVK
jgi:tetratricopeptide (TPR) repeat protein